MYPYMPALQGHAIIRKTHKYGRGIQVGDVIIAKHPWFLSYGMGKRVLGMPGDYVILDPPSSTHANVAGLGLGSNNMLGTAETEGMMVQVPEGHCWLGGDNLPWSRDSRHYGPVPLGLIQGKVIGHLFWRFPWPKYTAVKNTLEAVEWEEDEISVSPEAAKNWREALGLGGKEERVSEKEGKP